MDEQPAILVCALADAVMAVPGTVFDHACTRCGRKVMLAPTGQRVLREKQPVRIICRLCFETEKPEDIEVMPAGTVEEIRQEVRTARPNLRRNRN